MQHAEFETLIKNAIAAEGLSGALAVLQAAESEEVSDAAKALVGQFSAAQIDGQLRIYHVTEQENEQGEQEQFAEHIMNEGDDLIAFVAWFFESQFDYKPKEIYQIAGKTYRQPKRS